MNDVFQLNNEQNMLTIEAWKQFGVLAGFTTRKGGTSQPPYNDLNMGLHVNDRAEDVLKNRAYIASETKSPLSNWRCINQVHGNQIIDLTDQTLDRSSLTQASPKLEADGLISNHPSDFLVTYYADCVPLYAIAPEQQLFGLAHAGWRGTVGLIGQRLIQALIQQGAAIEDIHVAIGPSISSKNYEVNDYVANQVPDTFKEDVLEEKRPGHYLLDLQMLNSLLFQVEGISENQIYETNRCTYSDEDLFFSYRRDQGKTGRMAAFIGLID